MTEPDFSRKLAWTLADTTTGADLLFGYYHPASGALIIEPHWETELSEAAAFRHLVGRTAELADQFGEDILIGVLVDKRPDASLSPLDQQTPSDTDNLLV